MGFPKKRSARTIFAWVRLGLLGDDMNMPFAWGWGINLLAVRILDIFASVDNLWNFFALSGNFGIFLHDFPGVDLLGALTQMF